MALYGYPTITLKDKDTGKIKKEISCKNIQTIPARMMMTNVGYAGDSYRIGIRRSGSSSDPETYIYTTPYRIPKNPFTYINNKEQESSGTIYQATYADGQKAKSIADVTGIENVMWEQDADGRAILVVKGVLYAPESGIRQIGTIYVGFSWRSDFFTPLDEIIIQDASTVIDITYKIIVSGSNEREYIANLSGLLGYRNTSFTNPNGTISFPAGYADNATGLGTGNMYRDSGKSEIYGPIHTEMNSSQYNSIQTEYSRFDSRKPEVSAKFDRWSMSPSYKYSFSFPEMKKSGNIVGYIGRGSTSIHPDAIKKISNGKGVSTTFSKKRADKGSAIKPFFEASSAKKGSGMIKAVSATEKKGFPERWEIDVVKSGNLQEAEFRIRKAIVSEYLANSNVQVYSRVPHLAYYGNTNGMLYKKYNHPDGLLYESSPSIWPLYGQNIAIVIRKGVLLTSVGNARYLILDETNLPHENRGVQITGIAWDDSKKGLLIGCGESGLYRVDFDNDTDNEPVVKRVKKDGIEHVYAISGNGNGSVAIVTDTGIMYSDNLGETWNTKSFDAIKKQLKTSDEKITDSFDIVENLKHSCLAFVMTNDGESVGICLFSYKDTQYIPFIKLKTEDKWFRIGSSGSSGYTAYSSISYSSDSGFIRIYPICIGPAMAETEKTTIRDMVNSRKYALQPGAAWGIDTSGKSSMTWARTINIANGGIAGGNSNYNMSSLTGNEHGSGFHVTLDKNNDPTATPVSYGYDSVIDNGRWSIELQRDSETNKFSILVAGPNIGVIKDNPESFLYYSSDSSSFSKSKDAVFKTSSGQFEIDGVKFEATGERFEEGDCFIFHRTMAYVNDNVSTARFVAENSCLPASEWLEQSGTVSEENNKPTYRHPINYNRNMYKTQDGRLKTKDRTYTRLYELDASVPQYILPGSSKMKFDLTTMKGSFVIQIQTKSGSYNSNKNIFISRTDAGISYYCDKGYSNSRDRFLFSKTDILKTPGDFSISIDAEKRGVTVNDGATVIWTSGSDSSEYRQISSVKIVPVTTSKVSGTNKVGFISYLGGDLDGEDNGESEIFLPTFEYAYRGALCTRLGNENSLSGSFDPVFYGLPSIGSDSIFQVEIDGKQAEVVHSMDSQYSPDFFIKEEKPNRGGVSASISAGQVKIEPYTGLVFFSDEDIGKPYKIRYKYYKGDSLGIGETILE